MKIEMLLYYLVKDILRSMFHSLWQVIINFALIARIISIVLSFFNHHTSIISKTISKSNLVSVIKIKKK